MEAVEDGAVDRALDNVEKSAQACSTHITPGACGVKVEVSLNSTSGSIMNDVLFLSLEK